MTSKLKWDKRTTWPLWEKCRHCLAAPHTAQGRGEAELGSLLLRTCLGRGRDGCSPYPHCPVSELKNAGEPSSPRQLFLGYLDPAFPLGPSGPGGPIGKKGEKSVSNLFYSEQGEWNLHPNVTFV